MNFVLDTNILIHYIRKDEFAENLDTTFRPFATGNLPVVPIVVFGEVRSVAIQNRWGAKKLALLDELLLKVLRADITMEIVGRYAEIDAFSQGKLPHQSFSYFSDRVDEGLTSEEVANNTSSAFNIYK